jgi:molybdate transport system ATP-binding protein
MIQARIRKSLPAGGGSPGLSLAVEFASDGITMLFGPHGAGKSAVLESLAGLLTPDEGRVLVDDRILFDSAAGVNLSPRGRPCVYVPRAAGLFPHLSLRENLLFAAGSRGLAKLESHRSATELLGKFGLAEAASRRPRQLSPSEKLRGIFARALAGRPGTLLLDEPTYGLDAPLRVELYGLLRGVHRELGVTILAATGCVEDCFELGGRMLVLVAGKLAQAGSPAEVIDRPATIEVARALGGFNLLPVEITALDPGRNTSRLRFGDAELAGPYYPGRFRGDRVTLCVRPAELTASAGVERGGANQVTARLDQAIEFPEVVRLIFEGGLAVEISRAGYEQSKHRREWAVEFPPERLRIL